MVPRLQGPPRHLEAICVVGRRHGHQSGPSRRDVIARPQRQIHGHGAAHHISVSPTRKLHLRRTHRPIRSVLNGEFRQYKGSRDKESFMSFVVEKKWQQVEPVPYWKSPNSIQMSIVSTFFKLSQTLRVSGRVVVCKFPAD